MTSKRKTYLPRIKQRRLVQRYSQWGHDDQFKQQAQQQWNDSSNQQSYDEGLQDLDRQSENEQ